LFGNVDDVNFNIGKERQAWSFFLTQNSRPNGKKAVLALGKFMLRCDIRVKFTSKTSQVVYG